MMIQALALLAALSGAAQAAPHFYWVPGHGPVRAEAQTSTKLLYYGGPVISHAKVYAVFWGDGVAPETQSKIGPFYSNILDSTFMDWLSEYNTDGTAVDGSQGTHQTIGRGRYMGAIRIQPAHGSRNLSDGDIQAELETQIGAGRLPAPDANTLYMIYFPAGVSIGAAGQGSCEAFCAYHEGFKARSGASVFYGVMPTCASGCMADFDSVSSVSSHETLEAVTDPFPTPGSHPAYPQAWNTADGSEIADICDGHGTGTVTGHGIVSTVQSMWDNASNACVNGPWSQAPAAGRTLALPIALRLPLPLWDR